MNTLAILENEGTLFELNQKLKALAHPTRLKIIFALAKKARTVHEITVHTNFSQSNTSQQLTQLYNSNILYRYKVKNCVYYSLKDKRILEVLKYLMIEKT